jgi:hypothetical protein
MMRADLILLRLRMLTIFAMAGSVIAGAFFGWSGDVADCDIGQACSLLTPTPDHIHTGGIVIGLAIAFLTGAWRWTDSEARAPAAAIE